MRYLTKQKLEWLIDDNGVYVGAAEDQIDEEEGVSDTKYLSEHLRQSVSNFDADLLPQLDELMLDLQRIGRNRGYLGCWYRGSEETQEMWDEYGKDGVALLSEAWALESAFPKPLRQAMDFNPVIYNDKLKASPLHQPLRVKHEKFEHEKEFRFIFDLDRYKALTGFGGSVVRHGGVLSYESSLTTDCMSQQSIDQALKVIRWKGRGLVLDFDFGHAIHEVRVHPQATDDELLDVQQRLQSIGIRCPVKHSHLRRA